MKEQFKSQVFTIENIDLFLIHAFIVSFFMHYRINGFIAMLLIIFGVFKIISKKSPLNGGLGLLFFPALFLTLIIGQLYSTDIKEGWTLVERNLSLLLLPFSLASVQRFSAAQRTQITFTIVGTAFGFTFLCLLFAGINSYLAGSIYTIPDNTHFLYNRFMHHNLSDQLELHAVYVAIWVALANCIVFQKLLQRSITRKTRIILILLFLYFVGLLYLLKSANITFGFAISILVILGFHFGKSLFSSVKRTMLISAGLIILGLFTYQGISSKLENFQLSYNMSDEQMRPLGIRLSIWDCTWQVIQENSILGTGTGDSQHELVKKYAENNFSIGLKNDFNAHNMYLQYWMSNGLLALILFIVGLVILFRRALQNRNVIFLCFVLMFAIFSLTESTMRTQKGMLFFILFASLFYWIPNYLALDTSDK